MPILHDTPRRKRFIRQRREAEARAGLQHLEEAEGKASAERRSKRPIRCAWDLRLRQLDNYRMSEKWAVLRGKILDRDGHECKLCSSVFRLQAHHLSYPVEFGTEPLHTLITLCRSCHKAIHFDDNGKRRRDWRDFNPKPVLQKENPDESSNSV